MTHATLQILPTGLCTPAYQADQLRPFLAHASHATPLESRFCIFDTWLSTLVSEQRRHSFRPSMTTVFAKTSEMMWAHHTPQGHRTKTSKENNKPTRTHPRDLIDMRFPSKKWPEPEWPRQPLALLPCDRGLFSPNVPSLRMPVRSTSMSQFNPLLQDVMLRHSQVELRVPLWAGKSCLHANFTAFITESLLLSSTISWLLQPAALEQKNPTSKLSHVRQHDSCLGAASSLPKPQSFQPVVWSITATACETSAFGGIKILIPISSRTQDVQQ